MDYSYSSKSDLTDFAGQYKGERAFIIGNGPSLNKMDLTKLKDEVTFGVNSIFYNFDKMGFKPTFYVVEDKLVAEDRAEEISRITGTTKIFGTELQYCLKDSPEVIWANVIYDFSNYPGFPHFSKDSSQCLWVGGTVSYLCMQLAYYMGFSEVYLIGFDHNYTIPTDARIEGNVITSTSNDPNHFHPDYFGNGKRWHDPRTDRMELAYKSAKEAFEQNGRRVYNATVGGKLEIFPQVDYDSLFAEQKATFNVSSSPPSITPKPLFVNNNGNNKMRISVVVCTHRNPILLAKTLDSLSRQTLNQEQYEIIVIDNNSQDNTKNVVDNYPLCKYVLEEKLGLSHARNTGIEKAQADIIAFIDDDAEASPEWMDALLKVYDNVPDAWAVGGKVLPIWDAEKPDWIIEDYYRSLSLIEWGEDTRALQWPERIIGTNCSFRREVFSAAGLFKPYLGRIGNLMLSFEDTEIQQRIHNSGHLVYYNHNATVFHHVPASRMTRKYFCNRSLGNTMSEILMIASGRGNDHQVYQVVDKFSNMTNSRSGKLIESVEDQFLETLYSTFVRRCPEIPLEMKVKFCSTVVKYYMGLKNYEKAQRKCLEGMSLPGISKTQNCKFLLRMAAIYLKQDQYDQAHRKIWEALCTGQIENEEGHYAFEAFGEYCQRQNQFSEVKRLLNEILITQNISEQNKITSVRYSCMIYLDNEQYNEAEQIYLSMLSQANLENRSRDKLLLGLGELYTKCGRYSEARRILNKAVELEEFMAAEKHRHQPNPTTISCSVNKTLPSQQGDNFMKEPTHLPAKPNFSHLVLDYTRLCNSRCTYCGIWKTKNEPELSLDSIERTFSSLRAFGLSTCYLTGGEPYISDKVIDIARLLHQYLPKCKISGATNGIQPRQIMRRVRKILEIGVPVEVHVSINGRETTHDATRGGQGFWKKAVFLLDTLKSCQVPVVASMSLMPQTIADLPYMQQFCEERDIRLMYSWVRQCLRYGEVDGYYSTWPEAMKPKLREIEYLPDEFDCIGLSKRLVVTPDGNLYPCEVYHPDILLGNVNEESIEAILNSPRTASITRMISNKGCHWCQGVGENDGSPKWMLMDCYRRHSKQAAYLAQNHPQAVHMPPQRSKQVIESVLSDSSIRQTSCQEKENRNEKPQNYNDALKPRVSVVVCTHRNPALLIKTLESLSRQTLNQKQYEVIVVDNNSQDNTKDIVKAYPLFEYVLEEKLGLSHARNTGVENARADIIAFIDDDAEAEPNWLRALLNVYDNVPNAWAVGGKVLPIWDAPKPQWLTEEYHRSLSLIQWGEQQRALNWPERIIGTNCSFRRQVFSDIGYFDTSLGRIGPALLGNEDTEIQQRIHNLGRLVYYTHEAIVYHHVTASRMTEEYFEDRAQGTKISTAILNLRSQGRNQQADQIAAKIHKEITSSMLQENQAEADDQPGIPTPQLTKSQRIDALYDKITANSNRILMRHKDKYRGQRCVIIGNGPSLNNTDLSLLKNEYTFGLNKIYLLFDRIDWRPTFYACVNPFVLEQSDQQILSDMPGLKFLDFSSFKYHSYIDNIAYLLSLGSQGFSRNPCDGIFQSHTVTYVAMQIAYYLGFNEVFLIGVDHFYNAAEKGLPNQVIVQDGIDSDHFAPNYFGKDSQWHLPDLKGSEQGYRMAKAEYEKAGKKIYDATIGGHLNIFEKVDFYDVFGKTKNPNEFKPMQLGRK